MVLNDVWRTIGREVGFYYEANFSEVPGGPGVYAWFYPLRLLSREPDALDILVQDAQTLLNYDSGGLDAQEGAGRIPFTWWSLDVNAKRVPKPFECSGSLKSSWEAVRSNDSNFETLQKALLKATIFMPPLYVGKADSLATRCQQHIQGSGEGTFHGRFGDFAQKMKLSRRRVKELVFVCVRTGSSAVEAEVKPAVHELIESVMKAVCGPPYGLR